MDNLLYNMIFKRKSFHIFTGKKKISDEKLSSINSIFKQLKSLVEEIKVDFKIVPRSQTTCRRGEYCILLYSEKKENYLQNIGYIGEQIDLWLASINIGVCWYGMGKTDELIYNGLNFVIMLAIEEVEIAEFRKDMFKSKRKIVNDIWSGSKYRDIANIVRFAPSACNTQPWFVEEQNNQILIYRYKKSGKRGLMPASKVIYYNRIDIGIFILFTELCLKHKNILFKRTLLKDCEDNEMNFYALFDLLI